MKIQLAAILAVMTAAALPAAAQSTAGTTIEGPGVAYVDGTATQRPVPVQFSQIDTSKNVVLQFNVKAGVVSRPAYFGSDEYVVAPDFAIQFDYAKLRGLGEYGDATGQGRPRAFGLRGSLRYIPEVDASEYDAINGLDDVDPTLELGLGVGYRTRNFEGFADVRYGFGGSEAVYGELGADGVIYPTEKWEFRIGPRLGFGADGFAETYFGVSESESINSGLPQFDASGGMLSAGLVAKARYRFNDLWGVEATVRGDRLLNDAADSPITDTGSADQYRFSIGITRELLLQF